MIAIPLMVVCVLFSHQIIEIVFERGAFVSESTIRTGNAFLFYSIGIMPFAVCTYMGKVYYSAGDMKTPMICAAISVAVNILGDFLLVKTMEECGLALATSIANLVNAFFLLYLYNKHQFSIITKNEKVELLKIVVATSITAVVGILLNLLNDDFNSNMRKIVFVGICLICGIIYAAFIFLFRVKEFRRLLKANEE